MQSWSSTARNLCWYGLVRMEEKLQKLLVQFQHIRLQLEPYLPYVSAAVRTVARNPPLLYIVAFPALLILLRIFGGFMVWLFSISLVVYYYQKAVYERKQALYADFISQVCYSIRLTKKIHLVFSFFIAMPSDVIRGCFQGHHFLLPQPFVLFWQLMSFSLSIPAHASCVPPCGDNFCVKSLGCLTIK